GYQHAAGDPAQQAGPERNDQREAIDELENQCTPPNDDGNADDQTEHHVEELMVNVSVLSRAGDGDYVVQAHYQVGDEYGLDRAPHGSAAGDVAVSVFLGKQQLDTDPQEQRTAHHLEERDVEQ